MRKIIPLILFAGLISCSLTPSSLKLNCSKLKEGVFLTKIDTPYYRGEITRKGNIQIEKNLETGVSATVRIRWINDCKYSLTNISQTDSSSHYLKNKELIVEITKISGDTIYTVSHIPGLDFKAEIKMIKIK